MLQWISEVYGSLGFGPFVGGCAVIAFMIYCFVGNHGGKGGKGNNSSSSSNQGPTAGPTSGI